MRLTTSMKTKWRLVQTVGSDCRLQRAAEGWTLDRQIQGCTPVLLVLSNFVLAQAPYASLIVAHASVTMHCPTVTSCRRPQRPLPWSSIIGIRPIDTQEPDRVAGSDGKFARYHDSGHALLRRHSVLSNPSLARVELRRDQSLSAIAHKTTCSIDGSLSKSLGWGR